MAGNLKVVELRLCLFLCRLLETNEVYYRRIELIRFRRILILTVPTKKVKIASSF